MKEKISGIYRIVCVKNGRYYYGSSVDIRKRWSNGHLRLLRKGIHTNLIMQRCFNKHGESSLCIEIVECVPEQQLRDAEQKFLNEHVGKPNCMNIAIDAIAPARGNPSPMRGRKHTEAMLEKIRAARAKQVFSQESIEKGAAKRRGKKRSDKLKKRLSILATGRKHTPETLKKLSEAKKGKTWEEIFGAENAAARRKKAKETSDPSALLKYVKENGVWNKGKTGYSMPKRDAASKERSSVALKNSKKHKDVVSSSEYKQKVANAVREIWADPTSVFNTPEYRSSLGEARRLRWEREKISQTRFLKVYRIDATIVEKCAELGVSIPTYYKYKKLYNTK